MALLGSYIDSRTLASIAAAGSSSFAHGLPFAPSTVFVYENTTTDSTAAIKIARKFDATNVSIYNHGTNASTTLDVVSMYAHSIVR